jgi:hypothetical protein
MNPMLRHAWLVKLLQPRPSLSPSQFSDEAFRKLNEQMHMPLKANKQQLQ